MVEAVDLQDLPSCPQEGVAYQVDLEEVEAYPVASVVGSCPCPAAAAAVVAAAFLVEGGACLEEVALCPRGEVLPCPSAVDHPRVDPRENHEEVEACSVVVNLEGHL